MGATKAVAAVSGIALSATALVGLSAPAGAAVVRAAARHGSLVPTPGHILPVRGGTADSLNWAGYAVTGSGITGVDSTFTVPAAGLFPPGFAATWAGIGGYSTSDLIQAGVAEQGSVTSLLLGPQYYAWYEILPASETQISGCSGDPACTVTPGDRVSVHIANAGGDNWDVRLVDSGKWTYDKTIAYSSSESSAEWIQEAPTVAVQTIPAAVGTVHFGPTSTWTSGGVTRTIAAGQPTLINESPGLVNLATTSPLASDGQSFDVCVYAQTCS